MIIYKTINLINKKIYIGQDSKDRSIKEYAGSGTIFRRALKKYGIENFKKEILEEVPVGVDVFERENYWIEKLDARNRKVGYNIAKASKAFFTGCHHSNESKKSMSKNTSGNKHPMFGKHPSKETTQKKVDKISKRVYQYDLNGNFIKEHKSITTASIESGAIISCISKSCMIYTHTANGYMWSYKRLKNDESISRIKDIKNGKLHNQKKVYQYDLVGNFIKEYDSVLTAKKETGFVNISGCASGHSKTAGGYIWSYIPNSFNLNKLKKDWSKIKKSVIQYDLGGNFIKEYDSVITASVENNINSSGIANCCRGVTKSSMQYIWKYNLNKLKI